MTKIKISGGHQHNCQCTAYYNSNDKCNKYALLQATFGFGGLIVSAVFAFWKIVHFESPVAVNLIGIRWLDCLERIPRDRAGVLLDG